MDFEGVKETLSYSTIYRDQLKQSFIEEVQSRRETRYTYKLNHWLIITNFRQLATNITVVSEKIYLTKSFLRTGSIAGYAGYSPVFQPRRVNSVCQPNSRRCKSAHVFLDRENL